MYTPQEGDQLHQQTSMNGGSILSAYQTAQYYVTWNVLMWFTLAVVLPAYTAYKHAYLPLSSPLRQVSTFTNLKLMYKADQQKNFLYNKF